MKKPLTLSIIIPVYNEESHIGACLESISRQSVAPDEVIVVDNNCTDTTIAIARQFSFARIISEPNQGLIAARNRGFDEAQGNILARIDADVNLMPEWVDTVMKSFIVPSVAAVTGPAKTRLGFFRSGFATTLWSWAYFWASDAFFGVTILWGANMALRKKAWQIIRDDACLDDQAVHEDQDLSILLAGQGFLARRNNLMVVSTDGKTYHQWPKFKEYMLRRWRTKIYHSRHMTLKQSTAHKIPIIKRLCLGVFALPFTMVFVSSSLVVYAARSILRFKSIATSR